MGPHVETKESAAPVRLVLSTESILVRTTLCGVDTPRDGVTANLTRATWGARCGKSARRVLRGGTGTSGLTARLVPTHDNLDHDLMMRAVRKHVKDKWIILYIERWLNAPAQDAEGNLLKRERGTQQGGVLTPLTQKVILTVWRLQSAVFRRT